MTEPHEPPIGVLLMAHGTPAEPGELEPFLLSIRQGRPPSPELVADLHARYEAIGGLSPLTARTEAQRAGLQQALERIAPGRFVVALGTKHVSPSVEDAVATLDDQGVTDVVALVLAPHFSGFGTGGYLRRAREACAPRGLALHPIEAWYSLPAYVAFCADGVRATLRSTGTSADATKVLFTAHSLPERLLEDDPYPDQLRAGAEAVAAAAGLYPWAGWSLAWQSASPTPEPWRGPDIGRVIRELGHTRRAEGVVMCPHAFVADHLEVLYDLDILARSQAAEAGLAYARTPVMNDDPEVLAGLAGLVVDASREPAKRGL